MPGPGRRFRKGVPRHPAAGRRPGSRNKVTLGARAAIEAAAVELGGFKRIIEWAKEDPVNERLFWSQMYMKLLPTRIEGKDGGAVQIDVEHRLSREQLAKLLEERGLPSQVFGVDRPEPLTIEHQPQPGNGKANGLDGEGDDE